MAARNGYVAVHSQGLGHATRAVALARGLLERRPDLGFLFLAGSPALDLVVASGFDALTTPPVPDWPAQDGVLGPVWRWYRDYGRSYGVARRFLRREADWRYHRFLFSDSDLPSVAEALDHEVPVALLVNSTQHAFARDPLSRLVERFANRWFARLARRVDLLLTIDEELPWPNARRIGPVVRSPSQAREALREQLFFRKKTILVAPGGTGIGGFLVAAAVRAFRALDREDASMVVVTGPKLTVEPAPGVYTYGFIPNLQDMVLAADLVITTAGKSTTNEALAFGTPVIAIPPKGHAEAEANAAALGFRHEDVHRLEELIVEGLAEGRHAPRATGNEAAVGHLLDFLHGAVEQRP